MCTDRFVTNRLSIRSPTQDLLLSEVNIEDVAPGGDSVCAIAASPDGQHIISGSNDHSICVWATKTSELVSGPFGGQDCINSVAFLPDGKCFISGSANGTIRLWDTKIGELVPSPIQFNAMLLYTLPLLLFIVEGMDG